MGSVVKLIANMKTLACEENTPC